MTQFAYLNNRLKTFFPNESGACFYYKKSD